MRLALRLVLLAAAFAGAQWVLGWWAPAVVGAVWGGIAAGTPRPILTAAAAAAAGGAGWLAASAASGRLGALLEVLTGIFRLPGPLLLALPLLLGAGLAAAGCGAVLAVRRAS